MTRERAGVRVGVRGFQRELRWNQAYWRFAQGL